MSFPIEMYKIRQQKVVIKVPCEACCANGAVDDDCFKCGGKGVHKKTLILWKVAPRTETIYNINRTFSESYYGGIPVSYEEDLRYWTDMSVYYDDKDRLIHFTIKDAQRECEKRNKVILGGLGLSDKLKNKIYEKLNK